MMVSEFLSNEGGTQTLASDKNKKDHKHPRSKRLKPVVDYCQKQNDHKQRIFKHKTKKNGPKSYNHESQTTTFWIPASKHVFPTRSAKMIDGT